MKNSYIHTSVGLYINYILFGMVNIMLASNMSFLTEQFHTDKAGISFLVSAIGLGRLCTLYISGVLSDKYSRKLFVLLGGSMMAVFLIGIPLSPSYGWAVAFAVLAGIANSFLDSGTYPALMEAYPKSPGTAVVFVRGVISIGAMALPYLIILIMNKDLYFGYSFFVPALIFLVNAIYLLKSKFPGNTTQHKEQKADANQKQLFVNSPRFSREGVVLILIGFTGPALLYITQLWLPSYGEQVVGLSKTYALELLSYYSFGSLLSVVVLVIILHRFVKPVTIIFVYPSCSLIAFILLLIAKSSLMATIAAFTIGFFISGVLQLALTVMSEFFSEKKGEITGFIYTATSIAYTVIPFLTGLIQRNTNLVVVLIFAIAINIVGIALAGYVLYRYQFIFGKRMDPERLVMSKKVV